MVISSGHVNWMQAATSLFTCAVLQSLDGARIDCCQKKIGAVAY